MRVLKAVSLTLALVSSIWVTTAHRNASYLTSNIDAAPLLQDRPQGCPPCPRCFDCHYDEFVCTQFAECSQFNGKCSCPPGFGGDDCSEPVCGSLADGKERSPREGPTCNCKDGWEGVNCNVCSTNDACNAMMPEGEGGVCYKRGTVVKENYQMCDITNRKILDQLKEQTPQATFSCNADKKTCDFQFWIDQQESFYCALDTCSWSAHDFSDRNTTSYECDHIQCRCIPGRMLCGQEGSIDIGDFLKTDIKGPASFSSVSTEGGGREDGSKFQEPAMNNLIKSVFGDESITLDCRPGECLYKTEIPGYTRPVKEINTPLIAGVIAGCALFLVATTLIIWYLARRSNYKSHGPIYLADDDDDQAAKLMVNHKPASLQFEDLSYTLNNKTIISGISGVAHPGQVMAIMGASGAGKSTFLDILARKNKRGVVHGNLYVNGEKVPDDTYRNVVGFVDQEDAMFPTLTVHETIMTSALLRLPKDMGISAKEQRVYEVERQLGIHHIKDQMVGSEDGNGRGISGGEKRRVGIACELVTSPSILFLDEPTSGLDAFNAFNVVECLVTLAKTYNRTVVFTIHQPRSNIAALFDQLILLAKGRTVYSGPFLECQPYFDQVGFPCPLGFNIADYLVDLTMHAGATSNSVLENAPSNIRDLDDNSFVNDTSSTRAVKSIASTSNISGTNTTVGSPREQSYRSRGARKQSLKQAQDRHLFTRKKSNADTETPPTPRTDDEDNDDGGQVANDNHSWLRLSRQAAVVRPQIVEAREEIPFTAPAAGSDLDSLVSSYKECSVARRVHNDIRAAKEMATTANGTASDQGGEPSGGDGSMTSYRRVGLARQFLILSQRTWRNLYRNPMLMLTHYAIAIVLAVLSGYLFYGLTDDIPGFQDRLGLNFFILALFGFSTLTSLTVFSSERLLFIRERANGYYSPVTYFAAKVVFDIVPLRLLPPILTGVIVYPMAGLVPAWAQFFKFLLILVLFNFAAASICLFVGIVVRDGGVANLIGSLIMLFSLLFAGLLLNRDSIPKPALWLQDLSIFHYALEGLLVNEVTYLTLIDHSYGLDIEVPGASILSAFGFDTLAFWNDVIGLAIFTAVFLTIAYAAMHFFLVERR